MLYKRNLPSSAIQREKKLIMTRQIHSFKIKLNRISHDLLVEKKNDHAQVSIFKLSRKSSIHTRQLSLLHVGHMKPDKLREKDKILKFDYLFWPMKIKIWGTYKWITLSTVQQLDRAYFNVSTLNNNAESLFFVVSPGTGSFNTVASNIFTFLQLKIRLTKCLF